MRELKFINDDAIEDAVVFVDTDSIPKIMVWYGGYYAGDNYEVFVDNKKVNKNQNGKLVGNLP